MNLIYIRAAVEYATGVRLKLSDLKQILIEEGLVSKAKAKHLIFRGYSEFYDYFYKQDKNIIEGIKKDEKQLDLYEIIAEDEV